MNYARKGTKFSDEIKVIKVLEMNDLGIQKEEIRLWTREEFRTFFRELNQECL